MDWRGILVGAGLGVLGWAQGSVAPPELLLAEVAPEHLDPSHYLVSEKLDGVRAVWDGSVLRFRSGRIIAAPQSFLDRLPKQPLDGELWMGRGTFEACSLAVRRDPPKEEEWARITYHIFELPGAPGTFLQRAEAIQRLVEAAAIPQLVAVKQRCIPDRASLRRELEAVVSMGGEGLMLHRADAPYLSGRSDVLLKLKPLLDAEAEVVAVIPGKGRLKGRMGALKVKLPSGQTFLLGTGFDDATRDHPPALGKRVTYTYRGLTRHGIPRFASFLRVREGDS